LVWEDIAELLDIYWIFFRI